MKQKLGNKFKQDPFKYQPHLTLFQSKESSPLPNLTPQDLQICSTDSLKVDEKGTTFEPEVKLRVMTKQFGFRKVGSAQLVAQYTHDLSTASIVLSTPSSIVNKVSAMVWKAKERSCTSGKTKIINDLAKSLNKLSGNSLAQPTQSAKQLMHLAFISETPSNLDLQIKSLLAPDMDFTAKCNSCSKCIECIDIINLPAKEREIKRKSLEQTSLRAHVSLGTDDAGKQRVIVSLPLNHDQAAQLLPGSNRRSVLAELDRKLAKLEPKMKQDIVDEFNKLVSLGETPSPKISKIG